MLEQDIGGVMGRRTVAANAELLAFEFFEFVDAFAGENNLIVLCFHGGDEHEVVALQARLHDRADVDDRRIAGHQRLGRHLAAAQKDRLDFQAVFGEQAHFFRHPDVAWRKLNDG